MNDVPHTNMSTGTFFWTEEQCTTKAEPGSDYCWAHHPNTELSSERAAEPQQQKEADARRLLE